MSRAKRKECEASKLREQEEEFASNKIKSNNKVLINKIVKQAILSEEPNSDSSTMDQIYTFEQDKKEKLESLERLSSLNNGNQEILESNSKLSCDESSLTKSKGKDQTKKNINQSGEKQTNEEGYNEDENYQNISKPQEIFDCKYKPSEINFRDKEKTEIKNFLTRCIDNKQKNKCLLITGMPGGGKTLTVLSVLEEYAHKQKKFEYIKFNAMNYSSQASFMSDLYFKIFKKNIQNAAQELLTSIKQAKRSSHLTIFIDEFDNLFHSNNQEIFSLFNIANLDKANISILGVSNSMEMLFDLSKKYKIILPEMKNLVFEPYSQKEIYQIMQSRLKEMNQKLSISQDIIDDKALRLCSGKMYNLKGGDIRCLFDVCKKALEQLKQQEQNKPEQVQSQNSLDGEQEQEEEEEEEQQKQVTLPQLNQIIDKLYKVSYKFISEMPTEQILVILSIYAIIKQSEGIVEISFSQIKQSFDRVCESMCIGNSEVSKIYEILENLQSYQILKIRTKDNAQQSGRKKLQTNKTHENVMVFLKITTNDIEDALEEESKFELFFEQFNK